ncbi:hypothetical protein AC579_5499 [Pseudocercospora musae]|uniref:Uncharacterized protein n=1 Tax=Pseudocercospora musae TaxID=113226 RepID=A0A139IQC6_9PEZI|nr:hypothetical protein AC579_5499 [Pseudocercospora musae]
MECWRLLKCRAVEGNSDFGKKVGKERRIDWETSRRPIDIEFILIDARQDSVKERISKASREEKESRCLKEDFPFCTYVIPEEVGAAIKVAECMSIEPASGNEGGKYIGPYKPKVKKQGIKVGRSAVETAAKK